MMNVGDIMSTVGCSVHWEISLSTPGGVQYTGGYHEFTGGFQCNGGYHEYSRGYHDECGGYHEYSGSVQYTGGYSEYTGGYHDECGGNIMSTFSQ